MVVRRQGMQLSHSAPSWNARVPPPRAPSAPEPYVRELVDLADDRITELSHRLEDADAQRDMMQTRISSLQKKLELREREIGRLGQGMEEMHSLLPSIDHGNDISSDHVRHSFCRSLSFSFSGKCSPGVWLPLPWGQRRVRPGGQPLDCGATE